MNNGQNFSVAPGPMMPPVQGIEMTPGGFAAMQQVSEAKRKTHAIVFTIAVIILSLVSVTFIGLFIWMFFNYTDVKEDVDYQISIAVAAAKDEQAEVDAARYQNEAKNPLKTFAGPVDYGQITFSYPKTWSVYIAADAVNGGNYEAYFNPDKVELIGNNTLNALRFSIVNERYEDVVASYKGALEGDPPALNVEVITVGNAEMGTTTTANKYTGTIPGTEFNGMIVIFKIRDKTAIFRTDSMLFEQDFNALIDTITFNG